MTSLMRSCFFQPPTLENWGGNPPDVTLDYIVKDLLSFFNGFEYLHETKKKIEDTCDIKKGRGGCWSADDIKKAWKETQIMGIKSPKRRYWARVIMLQVLKRCLYYDGFNRIEAQSDLKEDETSPKLSDVAAEITPSETEQVPSEIPSSSETRNNMDTKATQDDDSNTITTIKEEKCLELLGTSLAELCVSNKENVKGKVNVLRSTNIAQVSVKEQTMTENPPDGSSQSNAERQKAEESEKNEMTQPHSGAVESDYSGKNGKRKIEEPERMEDESCKRLYKFSSQTVYLRIPLSVMSGDESTCRPEQVTNDNPTYKLIDRVPNLTDIRKKKSYVMLHDNRTRNAAWVYEKLNTSTVKKRKKKNFKVDNSIHPFYQAPESNNNKFFKLGTLHDRGHLAAAANHTWCQEAYDDTFLISNMARQHINLNRGKWLSLEKKCRKDINDEKNEIRNIHVYTGPLYLPRNGANPIVNYKMLGDKAVPTHFFKVIIKEKLDDTVELKCYQMPNEKLEPKKKLGEYEVKIEDIEKASGLIFRESCCNQ